MEKSRVKVPLHSSPNHPCYIQNIPSQESSQQEREWSYLYRVPESKPQLHPAPGELHWGRRKEEWLLGILFQTTLPKIGAHLKGKDRESKREVKVPSGTVRISEEAPKGKEYSWLPSSDNSSLSQSRSGMSQLSSRTNRTLLTIGARSVCHLGAVPSFLGGLAASLASPPLDFNSTFSSCDNQNYLSTLQNRAQLRTTGPEEARCFDSH